MTQQSKNNAQTSEPFKPDLQAYFFTEEKRKLFSTHYSYWEKITDNQLIKAGFNINVSSWEHNPDPLLKELHNYRTEHADLEKNATAEDILRRYMADRIVHAIESCSIWSSISALRKLNEISKASSLDEKLNEIIPEVPISIYSSNLKDDLSNLKFMEKYNEGKKLNFGDILTALDLILQQREVEGNNITVGAEDLLPSKLLKSVPDEFKEPKKRIEATRRLNPLSITVPFRGLGDDERASLGALKDVLVSAKRLTEELIRGTQEYKDELKSLQIKLDRLENDPYSKHNSQIQAISEEVHPIAAMLIQLAGSGLNDWMKNLQDFFYEANNTAVIDAEMIENNSQKIETKLKEILPNIREMICDNYLEILKNAEHDRTQNICELEISQSKTQPLEAKCR